MKFALISTDNDTWGFGIRMLSASLRKAGHRSRVVFLGTDDSAYTEEVLEQTKSLVEPADAIGIGCFSRGSARAHQVAQHLRTLGTPIVWGGLHASLNPAECAADADMVCRGEGDEAIVELAGTLEAGKDWRPLRNFGYGTGSDLVLNPLRPPFPNLDELPPFDFEPADKFYLEGRDVRPMPPPAANAQRTQALFIGSRGCAFHCTYCCNRKLKDLYAGNGRYLRRMSPGRYVEHLETLHKQYFPRASDFFLIDEDFLLRPLDEIREFSKLYRERVGIPFECHGSPPRVTEEKLSCLAEAGLWRLRMGAESGSERTKREVYDRPVSNDAILNASRVLKRKPNVVPAFYFIIGNPYEEPRDLLATLELMSRLAGPYYAQTFNLLFFPGSALYERALADGTIGGAWDSGGELHPRVGFQYKSHAWKRKNLYLNTLLFLADGKATALRIGFIPRFLLPSLIHPRVIRFADRWPSISATLIAGKMLALSLRSRLGAVLKKVIRTPGGVYNMPRYFRVTAREAAAKCASLVKRDSDNEIDRAA